MTEEKEQQKEGQDQGIDPQKIEQLISKVINDLGATSNVALAYVNIIRN